jgi:hypothetical protein
VRRRKQEGAAPGRGWWLALTALVAGTASAADAPSSAASSGVLQPYVARYQVSYRGLNGGEIESSFRRGKANGQWLYETRAYPSLLGRVAVSSQARERSVMQAAPGSVQPLSFDFDDGSDDTDKDVRLRYDWTLGTVTGQAGGKPVAFELTAGTQDTASVQAAMIQARLEGRKPQGFRIITGGKLRDYRYWQEGMQQVMTPFGQVEAEVWASQRNGSNRVSKVWHAPSLGYLPVQAIQYRKGNPEVQMKLVRLQQAN